MYIFHICFIAGTKVFTTTGFKNIEEINVGDFVLGPEAIYSIGVLKNTGLVNNASHLKFGVNARWKFVQAGVFKSIGKEIDFLGYRVGVTF